MNSIRVTILVEEREVRSNRLRSPSRRCRATLHTPSTLVNNDMTSKVSNAFWLLTRCLRTNSMKTMELGTAFTVPHQPTLQEDHILAIGAQQNWGC